MLQGFYYKKNRKIECFYAGKYNIEKNECLSLGGMQNMNKENQEMEVSTSTKWTIIGIKLTGRVQKATDSVQLSHLLVQSLCDQKALWHWWFYWAVIVTSSGYISELNNWVTLIKEVLYFSMIYLESALCHKTDWKVTCPLRGFLCSCVLHLFPASSYGQ